MIDFKTNKRLLKAVFLFKKFALSKGDSVLRRWVRNTIASNYIDKGQEKIKYGDVIEFILRKNRLCGFVYINDDSSEITRLFKHSQLTFPWDRSKERYRYWDNFFCEFEHYLFAHE